MKKIIKLTETDLTRIVKRVIEEQPEEVGDNISNKPEKLSTAEEFWYKNTGQSINQEEYQAMIEFAKLHVEAALKAAVINGELTHIKYTENDYCIDEKSIINSYPLENIK
jgi:hypothetical protein